MSRTRMYAGKAPFEEVWFCELRTAPGRGLWIRYTITDGRGPSGPIQDAAVWAMAFSRERVVADKAIHPLSALEGGGLFRVGGQRLDLAGAEGEVGQVSWSLRFEDRGHTHDHLPGLIKKLPVVTRKYQPAIFDLRASGHVEVAGERIELDGAPGVLGHIWGSRNSLVTWAWGHCSNFDGDANAVWEGLSGKLDRPILRNKSLATFGLVLDGRKYSFSSLRQWFKNTSTYGGRRWSFSARDGRVLLEGEAELPEPAATAHVQYTNTDGGAIFCANSRLCRLRVRLVDPKRGIDRTLTSDEAAFELGSRDPLPNLHLTGERSQYARV